MCCLEGPECWDLTQGDFIRRILRSPEQGTCSVMQEVATRTCRKLDLDLNHYYHKVKKIAARLALGDKIDDFDYSRIRQVTECTLKSARKLWYAPRIILATMKEYSPTGWADSREK